MQLGDRTVDEGAPLSITLGATDVDSPAAALTFGLVSPPAAVADDRLQFTGTTLYVDGGVNIMA